MNWKIKNLIGAIIIIITAILYVRDDLSTLMALLGYIIGWVIILFIGND
tara:strand:- start:2345 stop:2491 length:147 start_codon:yes stop_codon:yes gene_type:complete